MIIVIMLMIIIIMIQYNNVHNKCAMVMSETLRGTTPAGTLWGKDSGGRILCRKNTYIIIYQYRVNRLEYINIDNLIWYVYYDSKTSSGRLDGRDPAGDCSLFDVCVYIYIYIQRERDMFIYSCLYIYIHTHTPIHIYIYIYTYIYTCIHIYICTYIHVYSCIYTYTHKARCYTHTRLVEAVANSCQIRCSIITLQYKQYVEVATYICIYIYIYIYIYEDSGSEA